MSSIRRRPDGKWRARYRDSDGREHARHFGRKLDAQQWLESIVVDTATGRYVDPANDELTLRMYYDEYKKRQLWVHRTTASVDQAIASTTFLDVPFGKLRVSHVEQWIREQSESLAPSTIRTRLTQVRGVIRGAVGDRKLREDVTAGVKPPKARRKQHAMTIPSVGAVSRLLGAVEDQYRPMFALCAYAGLRIGEACAVRLEDFDLDAGTLQVQRQVVRKEGGGSELGPPKAESERVVYLPGGLVEMLRGHVEFWGVEDQLFWAAGRKLMTGSSADFRWRQARDRTGITCKIHDLRHFYASGLIAAGCDVVTVQRALGHSSATITLNTYAHLWPSAEDRTREAAATLMRVAS